MMQSPVETGPPKTRIKPTVAAPRVKVNAAVSRLARIRALTAGRHRTCADAARDRCSTAFLHQLSGSRTALTGPPVRAGSGGPRSHIYTRHGDLPAQFAGVRPAIPVRSFDNGA